VTSLYFNFFIEIAIDIEVAFDDDSNIHVFLKKVVDYRTSPDGNGKP
jgi:hypothetical protein